jgi:hypothetical protein
MKRHSWRWTVCAILLGLPVAAACSDAINGSEGNATDGSELEIAFPKMYSAFDGTHDFRIPAKVVGVKNVNWSADPADAVLLEKQSDGSVLITTKKPGTVKIIAKAGNLKASAPLEITEATADQWQEGSERYNNGIIRQRGKRDGGGGGRDQDGGGRGERKVDPSLACTNCHNKGGKGADVEHTPMQTAGYTDAELVSIFTEATKPDGVPMRTTSKDKWQKMHKWAMEPSEKEGLIIYLRSLEPEAQGEVDFGGRGWDDGQKRNRDNDGDKDRGGESK